MTGPLPTPPPRPPRPTGSRPTVYGAARRGRPHPVVLVALGVLVVGVLTGTVLALQALRSGDRPTARPAPSSGSAVPPPTSRPPSPSPSPSASPSSSPPAQPRQFAGVQGQGSGQCLDLQPDQPTAGGLVVLAPCARTPAQRWQLRADATVVNGASGLCLTVAGGAADDRARVQQEACQAAPHQQWGLFVGADGTATFVAAHSGKCLDVTDGRTDPGTPVQQFTCNDSPAQRWQLQPD